MSHKENINKIHFDLTTQFENVTIEENADRTFGNYVKIGVTEGLELTAMIEKVSIENDSFRWFYLSDPANEKSIVERKSNIHTFAKDVKGIFDNKRFDEDYIKRIEEEK